MKRTEVLSIPRSELDKAVGQALKDLKSPTKLQGSVCISTCLVVQRLREEATPAPYEVLQAVLGDTLAQLERSNPESADILRGRFWDRLTVKEMVRQARPQPWSERRFYERQEESLQDFMSVFWQQEETCRRELAAGELERQENDKVRSVEDNKTRFPVIGTIPTWVIPVSSFFILFVGVMATIFSWSRAADTPSLSPSPTPLASRIAQASPSTARTEIGFTPTKALTSTQTMAVSMCGGTMPKSAPDANRLLRHQGVSSFTKVNTDGIVRSDKIRALVADVRGLWIGYFSIENNASNGIGQFDKKGWVNCPLPGEATGNNINALATDSRGRVWAAAEKNGVLMFDGTLWRNYTITQGLPTNETFGLTVDQNDNIWVGTWEGVAKYDEAKDRWTTPYTVDNGTIFNNHVHAIAFDSKGNIWVGHIGRGVSQYDGSNGKWIHHTADKGNIGGDIVFGITVHRADSTSPESIWFATSNGVSKYEEGAWTTYRTDQGLPNDRTQAVAIDHYNRVWVATAGGVAYLDGQTWVTYDTIPTLSIAFGPPCSNCPFDGDHVWTGTEKIGLTHSRIPIPSNIQVVDILGVKYRKEDAPEEPFHNDIVVAPGDKMLVEIDVSPRAPYTLTETRGDFLSSIEETDDKRYGAYLQMAVKGTVESGQRFTFTDHDNPFVAPQLPDGVQEQEFTSRWRLWMHTRYVGPVIEVTFTVRRPAIAPASSPSSSP